MNNTVPPPAISVVLPVYNESESLRELLERLHRVLSQICRAYEILIVDDGSRDQTLDVAKAAAAESDRIVVVELARNYGQTAALAAGIDHAKGSVIVTMDSDLQHKPEEIPRFIELLDKGYDIVSGWRETRTDSVLLRKLPSKAANFMMRQLTGMKVRDFGSTFKAYRAKILHEIELFGELHRFIPVLGHKLGARIAEIPIKVEPRGKGRSNYGLGRIFGVFEDLVFLEFYSNYLTKPIRAFGRLFILFFFCGLAISVVLMALWCAGSVARVLDHGALLLFSVFLMIIGIQFLVAGILAELLSRIYLNTSNRKIYSVRHVHRPAAEEVPAQDT